MSLIKKLIQRLLDSRTTPAQAANASRSEFKQEDKVTQQLTVTVGSEEWTKLIDYIAPADGYVAFKAQIQDSSLARIGFYSGEDVGTICTTNIAGRTLSLLLPVSKGQVVAPFGQNLKTAYLIFFKAIGGGGYNRFVWRALSCLRALSLFSPRSSFRTNPNGLRPKAFQKGGCSCHLRLPNMSLLTMDTLAFTKTLQTQETLLMFMPLTQLIQSLQGFAWGALRKGLLHILQSFLLEKDARSLLLMMQIQSKNYGSRRLSAVINNLGVGGALC